MTLPSAPGDPAERARRLRAIALAVLAGLCFACVDASAKYLVAAYAFAQVVFVRYFGHLAITVAAAAAAGNLDLWRTRRPGLLLLRAAFLIGATGFNFVALRYLPLADAMAIFFSMPLIVAVISGPLLGEWIGPRRWLAVIAGFVGVLIITRPGMGGTHWAGLLSFGCAFCYACYAMTTRLLTTTDSNATQQFYSSLFGSLVMLPFVPAVWQTPGDATSLLLMIAIGAASFVGHGVIITAHRDAPAPVLAPFAYVQILWAGTIGFLAFGDIPTPWTLAGAAIVVGSGLYLFFRERQLKGG